MTRQRAPQHARGSSLAVLRWGPALNATAPPANCPTCPRTPNLAGGALLDISDHFGTSDGVNEVIVGAAKLGALGGTFLGGGLMLYYGRRPAIAVDSLFFIAGPLLMAAATNVM